ncbi:MAG: MFS transporter [Acholeplasmatales bacterium]|nr:MFS transporter [Acholeplasmatales bacterium]
METAINKKSFSIKDKLGYLFGNFGNDFTFVLASTFLLKFYTDVMAIDAWIVGIVMMISRFLDAFTDIAMGRICNKSRVTKNGKFKPWILRMCAPVVIASFLMYQASIADASMPIKIIWLSVTYILWGSILYTAINIPYGSMASTISSKPDDRQSLSTFRTMGGVLASSIISIIVPMIAYDKLTENGVTQSVLNGERFTIIAGVFSVLALIGYILCYFMTTERIEPKNEEKKQTSIKEMIINTFTNRSLISLIVGSIIMLVGQLTLQGMASYIFPDYYLNPEGQSISTFVMLGATVIAAAITKPLVKRFGKAEISVVAVFISAVFLILQFILRPDNMYVFIGLQSFVWLGIGIIMMVTWALVTDVIDDSEIKYGVREDGSIYAIYSFARKLGQSACSGIQGGLLSLIGYQVSTKNDPDVLNGIFNIATLIPAISMILLGLILWFWYPLHKKKVLENVEILRLKHEGENNETNN